MNTEAAVTMKPIAYVHTNLKEKFGAPRQSGVMKEYKGTIVFEPEYRIQEAFKDLDTFSHIWLIWNFSKSGDTFSPTVRPPRLGGNKRVGVFASRSPFRPNAIGLSVVKLDSIEYTKNYGPVLHVCGIDMIDGTPVFDIKPYIPYSDSIPDAKGGFTKGLSNLSLKVNFPENLLSKIPEENRKEIMEILSHDPRPQYQEDPDRVYGIKYLDYDITFTIEGDVSTVTDIK